MEAVDLDMPGAGDDVESVGAPDFDFAARLGRDPDRFARGAFAIDRDRRGRRVGAVFEDDDVAGDGGIDARLQVAREATS